MDDVIFIYGLYSTEDCNKIRYVGKTKFNLNKRLREHIKGALSYKRESHKDNWIRKTYQDGFEVGIKVIEMCNSSNWKEREQYWIKNLKFLTNISKGGDGGHGLTNILDYTSAKQYIKDNFKHIDSSIKYYKLTKDESFPRNILPIHPQIAYKIRGEWKGWGDFLQTNRISDKIISKGYYKFDEAKFKLKRFKLKNREEYILMFKDSTLFPTKPDRFYKDRGWNGWNDYIGNVPPSMEVFKRYIKMYFPFVNTKYQFEKHHPYMNYKIPLNVLKTYNINTFKDIFGYDKFLSYDEAVDFLKDKKFKSLEEYRKFLMENKIHFLPKKPNEFYKGDFKSLSDYFSNRATDVKNVDLNTFIRYMRIFHRNVKNSSEYKLMFNGEISKRIPKRPDSKYKLLWKELIDMWMC